MDLVVLVCAALIGSKFQDHCHDEHIIMHNATPQACLMKAQEVIAERAPLWDGRITSYRCNSRKN